MCAGENTTVQCGSGQVLMIYGGFYGRKNIYYCRSTQTTSTGHQCGWKDVVESLKGKPFVQFLSISLHVVVFRTINVIQFCAVQLSMQDVLKDLRYRMTTLGFTIVIVT